VAVETFRGQKYALAPAGATTAIKARAGRCIRLFITETAVAVTMKIHDAASIGTAAAGNRVFESAANPLIGTIYELDVPCTAGIVAVTGAGLTCTVVYS